jgi:hypothetical protein
MGQRESKISGAILDELKKEGVFAFKIHGSALMMNGLPDIIACVEGMFVGLETKVPEKRSNTSKVQKYVHGLITQSGGIAVVVCGVREAMAVINEVRKGLSNAPSLTATKETA